MHLPLLVRAACLVALWLAGPVAQAAGDPAPSPVSRKDALAMDSACALVNTFTKCLERKQLTIVVIGNSVSYGAACEDQRIDSYYVYLAEWFRRTFPEARIEVKTGIIFAIGPEVQLFRMEDKLLRQEPDLVVTEFGAANGAWGEIGRGVTEPATEGYVRRLREQRPEADLLLNLGLFTSLMEVYRRGEVPPSVAFQAALARHYGAVLTDPGSVIARRVVAGEPWNAFMKDGIHPGPGGYAVHGQVIAAELDRQYRLYQALPAAARRIQPHPRPAPSLRPDPWTNPRLLPAAAARLTGFQPGENGRVKFMAAEGPGAAGSFAPASGRLVGVLYQLPEHRGKAPFAELEVRLDGAAEWTRLPRAQEPRFLEDDDRANSFQRHFFGGYGLPVAARSLEFRVAGAAGQLQALRLVGFFVID